MAAGAAGAVVAGAATPAFTTRDSPKPTRAAPASIKTGWARPNSAAEVSRSPTFLSRRSLANRSILRPAPRTYSAMAGDWPSTDCAIASAVLATRPPCRRRPPWSGPRCPRLSVRGSLPCYGDPAPSEMISSELLAAMVPPKILHVVAASSERGSGLRGCTLPDVVTRFIATDHCWTAAFVRACNRPERLCLFP